MNAWDTEKRDWIVQQYHTSQSVRRDLGGTLPSRWTITRLFNLFAESGSIARRPYHRDPYVRVQETIAAVVSSIQANPRLSTFGNY